MSDFEDFELDMGSEQPKPAEEKKEPAPKKVETPATTKKPQAQPKEEAKNEFDEFEFEVSGLQGEAKAPEATSQPAAPANPQFTPTYVSDSGLPIPGEELSNTYLFMPHLSLIFNASGKITPLNNEKEIYLNSASCALYGEQSGGANFLITGGYFSEVITYEEDDQPEEPEYNHFYGTSRTFLASLSSYGTLALKRSANMLKQRYMHCCVNYWDGSQNHVLVIGGQHNMEMHDSVEKYDFEKKQWVMKASMNTPRTMASAVGVQDWVYVFGGFKDAQYYYAEPTFERYSVGEDKWEVIDCQNVAFSFIPGSILSRTDQNEILILGGVNQNTPEKSQTLYKYNPQDSSFTELNCEGLAVSMPKFFTSNGKIFKILGGSNSFRLLDYNTAMDKWSPAMYEEDIVKYLGDLNEFTKNKHQHIYQLLSYSSVVSHNLY